MFKGMQHSHAHSLTTAMSDFPDLGSEFATAPSSVISASSPGDIDFDRAASAFPDISLDGDGDFATPTAFASGGIGGGGGGGGFSFDDFGTPPAPNVKVTGDDEFGKFEDQFPELDVQVHIVACPHFRYMVHKLNVICMA
jgi:hypothetical protein